jgi:hypothetical protein
MKIKNQVGEGLVYKSYGLHCQTIITFSNHKVSGSNHPKVGLFTSNLRNITFWSITLRWGLEGGMFQENRE